MLNKRLLTIINIMKTIFLLITLSFLLFPGAGVLAQGTGLLGPGMTPDSPFYFLETIVEKIGTFFTFGDLKKAERYSILAEERLAEANVMAERGKSELAERTLAIYRIQLENSITLAERAQTKGENIKEAMVRVGQATSIHLEVLTKLYEKVPEQTKPAIENAMEVSLKGHEKAVEVLREQDTLGDIPEEVSLSEEIPQEVRERIEQKLQIEKAFENIDLSKSARDICMERGGTSEMCDILPSEKFESFEGLKNFCLGQGATPEICSSLESKCREYGMTEVNKCFIFLSVYSMGTYQSAELKVVPAPILSEEEIQQKQIQVGPQEQSIQTESIQTEKRLKQRYIPGVSKVIIYSSPTCPHCEDAKEWFQQYNIEYEEIDISQDETKQNELMEIVGQIAVPTIEVEGDMMVGFNEERFSELFGIE